MGSKRAGGQLAKKAVAKPKLAPATAPAAATGGATGAAFGTHQGAALSIMSPTAHPSQFLVNAQHWADVEKAWQAIVDHQVFCGIITEVPLGLEDAGIAPFSPVDFQQSTAGTSSYTCGANAFWASPFFATTPGVPINRAGVAAPAIQCKNLLHGL